MKNNQDKVDLRLPAEMSAASLFLSYLFGGVLLASENWAIALGVLVSGYGLASMLVVAGKRKAQKAHPTMVIVLAARKRRFLLGLGLSAVGLALLALGPGQLARVSSSQASSLFACGLIFALYGYYLTVSSYNHRPAVSRS